MRKIATKLLFVFVMLSIFIKVDALKSTSSGLLNRNVCPNFEVALANSDDTLTSVSCYDTYALALEAMNNSTDVNTIILEKINGKVKVINAKYALVYLNITDETYKNVYSSSSLRTEITYMSNDSDYGGVDGAFLGLNYSNHAIKLKISGVVGWIANNTYAIIPLSWVKSYSYYKISDSNISHYYASNIENSGYSQMYYKLGPKSNSSISELANGNYFSYDGIYFYQNQLDMLSDYLSGTYNKSVNKDNPYYNYYLYLPHRSKTNYDVDDLDKYFRQDRKFIGSIYGREALSGYSMLYGSSEYFLNGEKLYGANAILSLGLSINETAFGRSSISVRKNNMFGHNAVDGSAYSSATGYLDVRSSIYSHAYGYINYGYSEVADSRYRGGHFGNKLTGMNVQYASDVYWGEKAASYYYSIDNSNGMLDYNYYQLIISNGTQINARLLPTTNSKDVYSILYRGIPFILLEEVEGQSINGNNIWYKIQSDSNLNANGAIIGSNKATWPHYQWETSFVYVHSSYFYKINDAKNEDGSYNKPIDVISGTINKYTYNTYATNETYTPRVAQALENVDYFYSSSLTNKKGVILKGSYLTVLEEAKGENETNYLVITDYTTYQRHWVSGSNLKFVNKDLMKVSITNSGGYILATPVTSGGSSIKIYTDNYIPIVDTETISGKEYLKIQYKVDGTISYAYVDKGTSNIAYTLNHINTKPVISANDLTLVINGEYNLLKDVKGTDIEDGDITKNITITENTVDITKEGIYEVTYSLTDSYGDTVTKTIKATVKLHEEKPGLFMYNELKHKENNTFTVSGFMGVKGMDNKTVTHTMVFVNQITNVEYSFPLDNWQDYPYEMSSLDDDKNYDYSGGWFKMDLDLSKENLPNGDYTLYIKAVNANYESINLYTNVAYMEMTRRAKGNGRSFLIEIDYSTLNSPLLFSIRDNLIGEDIPKTLDPMYNFFNNITLDSDNLSIKGTSHNIGVSYGIDENVDRKIVFENTETFTRFIYDLGSISNGDYPITLAVSDNCDKTRAWYDKIFSIDSLPIGKYIIYIVNTVNDKTYYGELIDVAYTDFSKINTSKYQFIRNDNIRLRLELTVKE